MLAQHLPCPVVRRMLCLILAFSNKCIVLSYSIIRVLKFNPHFYGKIGLFIEINEGKVLDTHVTFCR